MKIEVETVKDIIHGISSNVFFSDDKDSWKIINPLIEKISELEEEIEGKAEGEELPEIVEFKKNIEQLQNEIECLKKENEENLKYASEKEDQRFLKFRTERENLLKDNDILEKEVNALREKNDNYRKNFSNLKNIFKGITKGLTIEGLYKKIEEIGILIDSDLSEQIELIKTINEGFREGQKEIRTLRCDKERIEIQWVQLQKENESLREKNNTLEDTNRKLSGELLNQTEEIHMLEEEIDRLKSANDDLIERIKKFEERNRELSGKIYDEKEALKEQISKLEDTNRRLSGELLNQNEEIHMLEEEIDHLKSANEDLKRLNRQIQEVQK